MKVGRNDPCPCGSGKKHKNCCLARAECRSMSPGDELLAAVAWLQHHHRQGFDRALGDFYDGVLLDDEDRSDRFLQLPEELQDMATINATEWLLAESEMEIRGERRRAADLILGPGGPPLAVEARQWLQLLAGHPMGVYEVQEAVPGEGLWVKDVATSRSRRLWVAERSASQSLNRWDILGARLVPVGEEWQLSGAAYPIPRDELPGLKADLRAAKRAGDRPSAPIITCWLRSITTPPPPLPRLVDAGSGEPLLLVTDHYDVTDWEELVAALARQPDVEGDRENGWGWLEEVEGQAFRRSKLALNPGKANRLEVFARTLRRAEEGSVWLRQVAGQTLTYRTREIADPIATLQQRPPGGEKPAPPATIPLPPEIHREVYRRWPEQPIPALGGLTPREAIRTRAGRLQVVELLKEYEQLEERSARASGHQPASFRFLWDELGILQPK